MTTLSKAIHDLDRKAQAILADLIPLVGEREVAEDPEFVQALQDALDKAHAKVEKAKTETEIRRKKENGSRPKETARPA